jgi:hypothetical protein
MPASAACSSSWDAAAAAAAALGAAEQAAAVAAAAAAAAPAVPVAHPPAAAVPAAMLSWTACAAGPVQWGRVSGPLGNKPPASEQQRQRAVGATILRVCLRWNASEELLPPHHFKQETYTRSCPSHCAWNSNPPPVEGHPARMPSHPFPPIALQPPHSRLILQPLLPAWLLLPLLLAWPLLPLRPAWMLLHPSVLLLSRWLAHLPLPVQPHSLPPLYQVQLLRLTVCYPSNLGATGSAWPSRQLPHQHCPCSRPCYQSCSAQAC